MSWGRRLSPRQLVTPRKKANHVVFPLRIIQSPTQSVGAAGARERLWKEEVKRGRKERGGKEEMEGGEKEGWGGRREGAGHPQVPELWSVSALPRSPPGVLTGP